ncbi:hypothetical protein EV659_106113 [Rhodothalassium salexigens DSM 2132]|uniref:CAAX prenyl protease 2/Lysostaphin resistance protein A-like domain-containing protein n=2 Tax=Rhodothalassium salexigens TaxID=1086 RepID=A0A4R2PJ36_RHOSA|nr:CPBP family intramembrane glutamic endopeptidase [Rhodothalassium salexigens]MBB4211747.1 hypothetical protein [Rhodothalassium salexigens DSM 2132]TCP33955.1 hypothetical protein EV659_106113 [Rhodothalassium salexigens DSM 2132]
MTSDRPNRPAPDAGSPPAAPGSTPSGGASSLRVPDGGPPPGPCPPTGSRAGAEALAVILTVTVPPFIAPALGLFSAVFGVAAATLFLARSGQSWASLGLARPARPWATLGQSTVLYGAVLVLVTGVLQPALTALGLGAPDVSAFSGVEGDTASWLALLAFSWVMAAFGEEMIARGFLLDRLARLIPSARGGLVLALVLQAALFGAAHAYQGPAGVILTGFLGLVFAIGYLLAGRNLLVPILAHGVTNTVSLTALYVGLGPA